MHIGMFGFGYWGSGPVFNAIKNNQKISKITICTKSSKPNIEVIPNKSIVFTNNPKDILLNKEINAVIIATPANTHYSIAKESLVAGKNILVEKPFTITFQEALDIIEIAEQNNLIAMVDHTFIYTDAVNFIKEYIASSNINTIKNYESYRLSLGKVNTTYNVAWDLAIHDIAILHYLGYKIPLSVQAVNCSCNNTVPSNMFINLKYENLIANIHVSWDYPEKIRAIYFLADKKVIEYRDNQQDKIIIYNKGYTYDGHNIEYINGNSEKPILKNSDAVCNMLNTFIGSINNQTKIINKEEILNTIKILEAIDKSFNNNGEVIEL